LVPLLAWGQSSLPTCPQSPSGFRLPSGLRWHNCFGEQTFSVRAKYVGEFREGKWHGQGTYTFPDSSKYVGEWREDKWHGLGIEYKADGSVERSGRWENGTLVQSYALDTARFPYLSTADVLRKSLAAALEAPALRGLGWRDRLERAVQSELRRWLAPSESLAEVEPPVFPAALSLRQEPWESNKEFEVRVDAARAERRQAIDTLQSQHRKAVEERNARVAQYNRTRAEREKGLAGYRRELVETGLAILAPVPALSSAAFDQQGGSLTLTAKIEGLETRSFAFADAPQAFRRAAFTAPQTLKASPEFRLSDAGELTLEAIVVEWDKARLRGVPAAAAIAAPVQLAAVELAASTPASSVAQSAVSVDRNQVEQILYREENEMLRSRLEAQRKQQELALAAEQAKAAVEIARLRAEAEALRKPAEPVRPAPNVATINEAHALVIGNAAYPGSNRLANPGNDARAMREKLESLGFRVTTLSDAGRDQMVRGLAQFSKAAARADLTLLFYAGHGVQISGINYMIPVDINLNDAAQARLQAVSLNDVVEQYLPGKTKLVFLDACRDNPLMASGARGITKGLAPINVSEGTLIAYATKDGQVAEDGAGQKNSPFTSALLEHLSDIEDIAVVLRKVREKVMAATGGKQQPWEYGSLTGGALVLSAIRR
jgi:uncharacterized caspase-like protein